MTHYFHLRRLAFILPCSLGLAILASDLWAQGLALPLTATKVETFLASTPEATVEDFLAALPLSLQESFVLMNASRSLHQATMLRPRQILFGSDARFIVAVGSVDSDLRRNLIEFAEFEPIRGLYHFGTIDFTSSPPEVRRDEELCKACHGDVSRPIWGQYPVWPGAYSDNEGKIAASEQAGFAEFAENASQLGRYRHLHFAAGPNGTTFGLTGRHYPFANTDFNHELGNTVAMGTFTRMKAAPRFGDWRWAVLATTPSLSCIDSNAWPDIVRKVNAAYSHHLFDRSPLQSSFSFVIPLASKAQILLGIDPLVDLSLEKFAGNAAGGSSGFWQTGAFRIDEAVAFLVLSDALAAGDPINRWFSGQSDTVARIQSYMQLTGEARAAALKQSYGWYPFFDVFEPITRSRSKLNEVCSYLSQAIPST